MNSSRRITFWKFAAFIVGCVEIAFYVFLFYLWQFDNHVFVTYKIEPIAFYVTAAINFIATVIWFSGIFSSKTAFMAISLTAWALELSLWLFAMLIYTTLKVSDKIDVRNKLVRDGLGRAMVKYFDGIAVRGTAFLVIFYLVAVSCYAKLKDSINRHRSEIPRANVVYTAAPTENW
ncbi:uncharacterized protein LOC129569723 [Sitodiplosis mosellana]|uniref:uncharacterized protein LOC129569723 n=1 Tax=Sitodiplosis mosellana TaxID=263140 RepID=UPI002444C000|nr:uncharacterized protein LOC129569723 [Sitodiplosis mosellana]